MTVTFDDVEVRFPRSPRPVFRALSMQLQDGEFVSIVGPSGCGKSTLLRVVAGLLAPTSGTVSVTPGRKTESAGKSPDGTGGEVVDTGAVRFGFVFQSPTLLPWRTAIDNLRLPAELGSGPADRPGVDRTQLLSLLQQVGLTSADADKRPAELSGGMQMRLSLARALVMNPDILLLDEPLAAVDDLLRMKLQEDIRALHDQRRLTTILVTHNLPEAVFLSDRVIVMQGTPAGIVAEEVTDLPTPRNNAVRRMPQIAATVDRLAGTLFGEQP